MGEAMTKTVESQAKQLKRARADVREVRRLLDAAEARVSSVTRESMTACRAAKHAADAAREECTALMARIADLEREGAAQRAEIERLTGLLTNCQRANADLRMSLSSLAQHPVETPGPSDKCEHGIPRRFCTALHAPLETGDSNGPV